MSAAKKRRLDYQPVFHLQEKDNELLKQIKELKKEIKFLKKEMKEIKETSKENSEKLDNIDCRILDQKLENSISEMENVKLTDCNYIS